MARIKYLYVTVFMLMKYAIVDISAQNQELKYNCFTESHEGQCEASRIKVCGDFYSCDLVLKLDSPPKRIGYTNGEILFSADGKTYGISNGRSQAELVNKVISPLGELIDKKGNIYFGGDGTTYVVQKGTGKEVEIVTTGSYSYNQHALDAEANKLFVLSFDSDANPNDRTGHIYAVTTDPLAIVNDKVTAELVSGVGDKITALAVQGGLEFLLLGTKENDGGKLIRLKRNKYDPCSQKESNKLAILDLMKEVGGKIIEIIDAVPEPMTRGSVFATKYTDKDFTHLSRENLRLKREVQMTNDKLKMFSNRLVGFSKNFRSGSEVYPMQQPYPKREQSPEVYETERPYPKREESVPKLDQDFLSSVFPLMPTSAYPPVALSKQETTTNVPSTTTDGNDYGFPTYEVAKLPESSFIECLPQQDLTRLRNQVNILTDRERELQFKFAVLIGQLDGVVNNNSPETFLEN